MRTQIYPMTLAPTICIIQQVTPFDYGAALMVPTITQATALTSFELETAKREIKDLGELEEGWDGYEAVPILKQTTRNAAAAVEQLIGFTPCPEIVPNSNGTISLEWHSDFGIGHLEIGKTRYSFYIQPRGGSPILADGAADSIVSTLGLFVASTLYPLQRAPAGATVAIVGLQTAHRNL